MQNVAISVALLLASGLAGSPALGNDAPSAWSYPVNPPGLKPAPDDGTPRHVPDSDGAFTLSQIRDLFFAPAWHPGDYSAMPEIVARGRKPDVLACGSCHRADGSGGPENAKIAGLPAAYIVQQMADFKSDPRRSSVLEGLPPQLMITTAKAINDQEIEAAAAYFSALRGAERLIAVIIGGISIVLGFWLFLRIPSQTNASGKVVLPGNISIVVSRVGPGVFFALFGAVLVGLSFYFGVKIETFNDGSRSAYSGFGDARSASVDHGKLVDRKKALRNILVLNDIPDAIREELRPADRADIEWAVDDAKLALIEQAWTAEWGDPHEFNLWLEKGRPQQPPDTPLGKAIAAFNGRKGGAR